MRDAGCGMRDAGCGMRDAGCRISDKILISQFHHFTISPFKQ